MKNPKLKIKKKLPPHLMRRNAGPPTPRASRKTAEPESPDSLMPTLRRLAPLAGGAAGMALLGTFLAREGWKPKTIAGALSLAGALLAWLGHDEKLRQIALGAAAAGMGQLALMMFEAHEAEAHGTQVAAADKPRQAEGLPPGALESAFERARRRLALDADEAARFGRAA
jgi:hypothetical protein